MADKNAIKVVLKHTVLQGSHDPRLLQRVATVYVNGEEYRVSAPPEARGNALDWFPHFCVRQVVDWESENDLTHQASGILALKAVKEELEKQQSGSRIADGKHPDGLHCTAQICMKGHVQHFDGKPFDPDAHCPVCGSKCIDVCPHCGDPIPGVEIYKGMDYSRPQFCRKCGRPFPWMAERLQTANDLLQHDDQLTLDDRNSLWSDLQYVMSDPKADLVPAKKRLIDIKLGKATQYVREAILDLLAKTTAEVLKG